MPLMIYGIFTWTVTNIIFPLQFIIKITNSKRGDKPKDYIGYDTGDQQNG